MKLTIIRKVERASKWCVKGCVLPTFMNVG
jgi:hypothetical protein